MFYVLNGCVRYVYLYKYIIYLFEDFTCERIQLKKIYTWNIFYLLFDICTIFLSMQESIPMKFNVILSTLKWKYTSTHIHADEVVPVCICILSQVGMLLFVTVYKYNQYTDLITT